jgi:hypothetical protein
MTKKCLPIHELALLAELSVEDPRRAHVEDCPRCSAMYAAWKSFAGSGAVEGADPESAERQLESAIRKMVSAHAGASRPKTSFFDVAWLRPAFAAITVALVAAVVWWQPWQSEELVLRGIDRTATAPLALETPEAVEDTLMLSWAAFDGADEYQVRFYSEELEEIARIKATGPTLTITGSDISDDLEPGTVLVWRVVALIDGDSVATSPPGQLVLP